MNLKASDSTFAGVELRACLHRNHLQLEFGSRPLGAFSYKCCIRRLCSTWDKAKQTFKTCLYSIV